MQQLSIGVVCMFLQVATAAAGDDAVRLLYRLPLHHVTNYVSRSQMTQQFAIMNESVESLVSIEASLRSEVVDRLMNEAVVDLHADSLSVTTHVRGKGAPESSDTLRRVPTHRHLQRFVVEPHGALRRLDRDDDRRDDRGIAGTSIERQSEDVVLLLENTKVLDHLFLRFPTHDVMVYDTWNLPYADTVVAPQGMGEIAVEGTLHYTYMGTVDTMGRHCWVIDWSATGLDQYGSFARSGVTMTIRGTAQVAGRSLHCTRTGEVVALTSHTHSVLTMTSTEMPDVVFPVHTTLVTTIHQQPRHR